MQMQPIIIAEIFLMVMTMTTHKFSLITLACLTAYNATAAEQSDLERITVYQKQNHVVLNSGLATKSDMSLMETPAPVVVVDPFLLLSIGYGTSDNSTQQRQRRHRRNYEPVDLHTGSPIGFSSLGATALQSWPLVMTQDSPLR
ncbi:hypothetical protein LCGC14_2539700 [marine sediment metagenome]|uniref:Uncharacterized protein n=1 Tax=marine sediment metagenome TaxID=412755 RepID=A0A0F9D2K7_9ZZZZ